MTKSIVEFFVGSLDEKRAYRLMMKRAKALPSEYYFAFKKIQKYMYNVDLSSCGMRVFNDLIDLLEESAAQGRAVLDVVGKDVASFCDQLIIASSDQSVSAKVKLNKEIWIHFHKEDAS